MIIKKWIFKHLIKNYYIRVRFLSIWWYFYPDMRFRVARVPRPIYRIRPIFIWRRKEQTHIYVDGRRFVFKRIFIFGKATHFVSVSPRKWLNRLNGRETYMEEIEAYNLLKQKKEDKMKVNVEIAKICHEANREYCIENQLKTHAKWDELPDDLQESIIAGVAKVIENPKITAEEMHDNWINYKAEQGWLYGDELDIAEKLHPNMVIWKKLSKVERGKDKLFLYIVKREMRA